MVLVSSGSIALGRRVLRLPEHGLSLEQSQAAAAVGQIRLAQAYETVLAPHGLTTAQVLVTLEDSENRRRYLNSRRTFGTLLDLGVVPIVNENDTVATDEIRYGDNDRLAAQVASMASADVLVLLSDVDGLYTADPRSDPGARRLERVEAITPEIEAMAGGAGSALSRGGMRTKLMAARVAVAAGCAMAISEGAVDRPIAALIGGAQLHLVRAARRSARGAQALDLGHEAARTHHRRRRRGDRARARQVAAAGGRHRASRAASGAATRSRSPGRTGRWSARRSPATMPSRRESSWATARTGSRSCSATPAAPRWCTATTWRSEDGTTAWTCAST